MLSGKQTGETEGYLKRVILASKERETGCSALEQGEGRSGKWPVDVSGFEIHRKPATGSFSAC